jgi:hypothetical protein
MSWLQNSTRSWITSYHRNHWHRAIEQAHANYVADRESLLCLIIACDETQRPISKSSEILLHAASSGYGSIEQIGFIRDFDPLWVALRK